MTMILDLINVQTFYYQIGKSIRNVNILGVDISPSIHTDKRKNILVISEGLTEALGDTTMTAGTKYSVNFTKSKMKVWLSQ